jgi:ribosomal protein S27E
MTKQTQDVSLTEPRTTRDKDNLLDVTCPRCKRYLCAALPGSAVRCPKCKIMIKALERLRRSPADVWRWRNGSGCPDPTAGEALKNVARNERGCG